MTTQCPDDLLSRARDVLRRLSDNDLLRRAGELTSRSRHTEVALLAHLGEIDARRLYLREACSSLFAFCTERLHFSEGETFHRIAAARAGREYPVILEMLGDGRLHLTAVALLGPHLTAANCDAVLSRAVHRSKRQVQELVAELSPRPDVPSLVRKLPTGVGPVTSAGAAVSSAASAGGLAPCPGNVDRFDSPVSAPSAGVPALQQPGGRRLPQDAPPPRASTRQPAATAEPLAPDRYKVQFTASRELRDKLERLRALRRSMVPDGDLAVIIGIAITNDLARLEARKSARTKSPRKSLAETETAASSRHVPAAVRRAVHGRDGGQCAYRDDQGRRCSARVWLQFHHRHPYGYGGDHSVGNVALLCRAHDMYLAEIDYGTRDAAAEMLATAHSLATTAAADG